MSLTAIVVGGGSSTRTGGTDKLMLELGGKTVFERSIEAMCRCAEVDCVVAVARKDLLPRILPLMARYPKLAAVTAGGSSRCLSVKAGLDACPAQTDFVAIHDAARPFVSEELVSRVVQAAKEHGAAVPGIKVKDTIKTVSPDGEISGTLQRNSLIAVQTPQVFPMKAYMDVIDGEDEAFDDCQLYEKTGRKVFVAQGDEENFKITTSEDIRKAEAMFMVPVTDVRMGHGYDVHRLVEGRKLILGGVEIPYEKGLLGHSDADVLLHAIADAVLGAASLRDIGVHFPDNDPAYEGADSRVLLRHCVSLAKEKGYSISNADATVICQRPKLAGHIPEMTRNIAEDLGVEEDRVNVKATTEEKLGFTGEGLGISAHAVVTLIK